MLLVSRLREKYQTNFPYRFCRHSTSLLTVSSGRVSALDQSVQLCHRHDHRHRIPILFADEVGIKFPDPSICHVLLLGVLRTKRPMNVVTQFVEKHMPEYKLRGNRKPSGRTLQTFHNFVYPQLDPRRGIGNVCGSMIATENKAFFNFSFSRPNLPFAIPSGQR